MTRPGRARAGLIGVVLAVAAVLLLPLTALGQTTASRGSAGAANYSVTDGRFDIVLTPPASADPTVPEKIDESSIRLTATARGGEPLAIPSKPQLLQRSDSTVRRSAMLALDTSGSMTPTRLQAAKQAAYLFLENVDKNVRVGLVTFGDPARLVIAPTTDRTQVRDAVRGLTARGDTALYEAVVRAADAMGTSGTRSIVMLTDGVNEDKAGARFAAADAQKALDSDPRSKIDFAGVVVGADQRADIDRIAGKDAVVTADDTDGLTARLNQVFNAGAERIAQQVRVTAPVPPALAGRSVTVSLTAQTASGRSVVYLDNSSFTLPSATGPDTGAVGGPNPVTPDRRLTAVTTPVAVGALVALFLAVAVLVFLATGALTRSEEPESTVIRRLSVYSVATRQPQQIAVTEQTTTRLGDSALARSAVGLMSRLARSGQIERALDSRLEAAGLPLRTAEWMLLHVGVAVGTSLLLALVARGSWLGLLLGLVIGLLLPAGALVVLRTRRESNFLRQLPDTLQLLAGSLAAGYSLPQAMDSVVREAKPPISVEFNRALIEARLGMPPEDALDGIAQRTASKDFSWIVLAIRIQRDVGGNLAELLSSVAETLRERERLRRQVNALAAEGKLSGVILVALPVVFTLYLSLVRPEYISPLVTTPLGWLLVITGLVLLAVGAFWMIRVIKVDV